MSTSTLHPPFAQNNRSWKSTQHVGSGFLLALVLLLLSGPAALAQALSGAYTINSGAATGGTNFASFTAAAAALNTNGVSGPVTFTVSGGPYTEQVKLNQITGASATNRITINGGGRTLQYGSSASAQRAVLTLDGADFVTINNLLVDATEGGTSTATYGWGIHLLNNADNNVINGCTVTTNTTATTTNFAGIVSSASTTGATTSGANSNQNLTLTGNTVTGGYYGITAVGVSTAAPSPGMIISNNTVRDFYFYGIYTSYLTGPQLIGNDVARPTRATVSTFYGIYLTTSVGGAKVEKNRIHQAFSGAATSTSAVYALYVSTSTTATATSPNEFINNLIYDLDGNGTVYGIYNTGSSNTRYYHNTINIDDQTNTSSNTTYGFYQSTGTGVEFRNNIVQVTRAGSGTSYAVYLSSTTGTTTSNNNDLTGSGNNFNTGYYSGTAYPTLANWQTANSGAYDQNSVAVRPQFVGSATGNLRPTAAPLNNTAAPLARVTDDFTGAARSATPDMGAYEFTPASDDVVLVSIDSPVSPVQAGTRPVSATIRNNGGAPLTSLRIQYVLNNGTAVVQNLTGLNVASGATQSVSFTTPATLLVGANTLTVTVSLPNGSTDPTPANNTLSTTLYTSLSGTYTINKQQPTGGTNFASFTEAGTALTAAGISGSVRFNVLNGPYDEQFVLGEIQGASATDTIVVDGGASKQTLSYTTASSGAPAAVLLNGSDYVTLQNLTIDVSTNGTYGIGVHLVGQAINNRVRNCVVMGPASSTSSTANAAVAASNSITSVSTTGSEPTNLRLENNVFSGGYYGVRLNGISTTSRVDGIRIIGNEVKDFYVYGVYLYYPSTAQVLNNNIHRTTRTSVSTFYGVYLYYALGVKVEANRIHDAFTGAPSSTSSAYGFYMSSSDGVVGSENDIINNLVYNFNGAGTEYGVYNTGSAYARYYHNTFSLDNQAYTGSALTYGIYQTTAAVGIEVLNNLFSVTRAGTGNRYALYYVTTTSSITSNYNDLYVGTGSNYFTGRYGSSNYATLADWRGANNGAYGQNSLQVNPLFASVANNDYHPTSVQLSGAGTATTLARVPRDLAGTLRTSPPDVGAYQLILVANDVAVVSIDSPTGTIAPTSTPVRVTIRNGGTTVLNSVTLTYTLNSSAPVAQTFTGLNLASGTNTQLTFTTGILAPSGQNTLTVTSSLPNGGVDGNASNNTQTVTFLQPTPLNDEPCGALTLNGAIAASNTGATTSLQNGITLPACAPSQAPNDVWFKFTPSGTSMTLYLAGNPSGMVRVFRTADCAAGPFTQVFCTSSGAFNTSVGTVNVTGLTAGQLYYVAVSGFGSSDLTGAFTISTSPLSTRHSQASQALTVYPNPTATGQLTLRLTDVKGAGTVELLNALGQSVRQQALAAAGGEQTLSTRGLAAGVYTLRVQVAGQLLTRKVVVQ